MSFGSLVLGLINGLLIGLLAVGLVLVYRSNRFLNLAHAQLGVLSTQLLGKLVLDWGWNWFVAFAVCVPVGMAIGAVVDRYFIRPLRQRSPSTVSLLLLTLGVSQVLLVFSFISAFGPSTTKLFTSGYPQPFGSTARVGGVALTGADLLILVMVPLLVGGLGLFLRYSTLGKTMRAAASNSDQARLCGISTGRVSLVTWAVAGGVSAIAGILQAPNQSAFDAATLGPQLLLLSLGAAAVGAFVSLPLALAGGVLVGVVDQLVLAATSNEADGQLAVLALVVAIVLVRGSAIGRVFSAGGAVADDRPPLRIPAALRGQAVARYFRPTSVLVALAVGLLLPLAPLLRSQSDRYQLSLIVIYALVGISLTVAIGWAGQVSLGQFALLGVGAFAGAHLLQRNWSLPFAVLVGGLIAAAFMVLIGLPALRVPGLTLAVTTLGFAVVAPDWLFHQTWIGSANGVLDIGVPAMARGIGRPGGNLAVYYFCLGVMVLAAAAMWALRRSAPGRLIVAVRDNESAAAAFGVTPATVKLAALTVSGFLAGVAGVLWTDAWRNLNVGLMTPDVSISVLAIPVIGGIGSIPGAIAAAVVIEGVSFAVSPHLGSVFPAGNAGVASTLLFGGLSQVLVLHKYPQGIAGAVQTWWQRRLDRMADQAVAAPVASASTCLVVDSIELAFGGLRVLNGTSIEVRPGEIVGLIGPNGAGKTTLLNVVSGRLRPSAGRIELCGVDVTGLDPEMRAGYGLSRSFQDARLFPGLTVRETVQVALANRYHVGVLSSMVSAPWVRASETESREEADTIIDRLGLAPWSDTLTSSLSTGTRRICDLAAQVAAHPKLLLLDEPTAGVAQREAEAFGPLLRRIRDELDCAILIVEHDMPLLMGLCDRIYAMELGAVIASGPPEDVRRDPAVVASYLGTEQAAIDRSGSTKDLQPAGASRARTASRKAGKPPAAAVKRARPVKRGQPAG